MKNLEEKIIKLEAQVKQLKEEVKEWKRKCFECQEDSARFQEQINHLNMEDS